MVETEREILREKDETNRLGERRPFDSSRQAEYEDTFPADERTWNDDDDE